MKPVTLDSKFALVVYDLPAPDRWRVKYEFKFAISKDESLLDDWKDLLRENNFEDFVLGIKEIDELPFLTRSRYRKLIKAAFNSDIDLWTILVDDRRVEHETDKVILYSTKFSVAKLVQPNAICEQSTDDRRPILRSIKYLSLTFSSEVFTEKDLIFNPRYYEGNSRVSDEFAKVSTVFLTSRKAFTSRLRKNFLIQQRSVFLLPLESAFAPNLTDPFRYDPESAEIVITYEPDEHGNTSFERNIFSGGVRDPRTGDTFEEICISEMMPAYILVNEYVRNGSGNIRARFLSHSHLLHRNLTNWVKILVFKPVDNVNMLQDVRRFFESSINDINEGDTEFHKMIREIDDIIKKARDPNIRTLSRNLKKSYNTRFKNYKRIISSSYNAMILDNANIQLVIKRLRDLRNPVLDTNWDEPVDDNDLRVQISIWLRDQGWFFTIPDRLYYVDENLMEDPTLQQVRRELENKFIELAEVRDEIADRERTPRRNNYPR